ncbi:MAG TPA: plastocyanin/azurin family copper-binding protein [Gemmatimonadaceae bacterium]
MAVPTRALVAVTCLAASAYGGGGYGSPSSPTSPNTPPVADQVNATASLAFDPSTLNTTVGHTVTFKFGSVGHNIYFDAATGAPADIPGVNSNASVTRTFDAAGTYTYSCHIHPYMQGMVVVK